MSRRRLLEKANKQFKVEQGGGFRRHTLPIIAAMRGRGLTPKHFGLLADFADSYRKRAVEPIFFSSTRASDPKTKGTYFSLTSVALEPDEGELHDRYVIPKYTHISMGSSKRSDHYSLEERNLPLKIHAQHVEFRHIQRTTKPFSYNSVPTQRSIMMSLALGAALTEGGTQTPEFEPIMLAHENGLFLGIILPNRDLNQTEPKCWGGKKNKNPTNFFGPVFRDHITTNYTIVLSTFITPELFTEAQREVWEAQLEFMDYPLRSEEEVLPEHGLDAIWDLFLDNAFMNKKDVSADLQDLAQKTIEQIKAITQSKAWRVAAQMKPKNLEEILANFGVSIHPHSLLPLRHGSSSP